MNELTIDGLTLEQVEMLDKMWSLDSEDEFIEWYSRELNDKERDMCDLLMRLIIIERFDQEANKKKDFPDAKKVLSKFRLGA